MKNKLVLKKTFYSLIAVFILILTFFLIPDFSFFGCTRAMLFPLVAILGLVFLILGIKLAFIAKKEKGKLKLFLMLTGISAIAPLPFTILHNLFYGLATVFENFKYLFEALHAGFFIISIIIAPIVFIIGIMGSFFLLRSIDEK